MPFAEMNMLGKQLAGGPQLGLGIFYPAPGIIERIGRDWDWMWIDGQHGELGYSSILAAVRASNLVGRPTCVRVPGHEASWIGLVLDTAADAVMVPVVDNADQARAAVAAAKFPPIGSRSYGGRRPVDLYGRGYSRQDRDQPLLVCQIETEEGVENAASIAAVDGVDVLFFGADDLAMRKGMVMDEPRCEGCFDDELRRVAAAAAEHGKFCGGVFPTVDALKVAVELGYRLITVAADVMLLAAASTARAESFRSVC